MNARWLAAGALAVSLALANGCGGGKACKTSAECENDGVCYGGFCVDRTSLQAIGTGDAAETDGDDAGNVSKDAGAEPDAGQMNNGRDAN